MAEKIRVLLVDDEEIVRQAIRTLLEIEGPILVVGEAVSAKEAIHKARALRPDIILLDLRLQDDSGAHVVEELLKQDRNARILILSAYASDAEVFAAFKAGAQGYVLKTQTIAELIQAIEQVHHGQSALHPMIARMILQELNVPSHQPEVAKSLSEAEIRVLSYVGQGYSNQDIADKLGLRYATVRVYMSNILKKLQLSNRTQVALYALKTGVTTLEPSKAH